MPCITPPLLRNGDIIAITSPASAVDPAYIDGAAKTLAAEGFTPRIMPHATGRHGSFSGTEVQRLSDLQSAISDSEVKAILCSRGGYGAVHLLQQLKLEQPKWLIGFSDISALHALWLHHGWQSVHGSMAKELALRKCPNNDANQRLFQILRTGKMPDIEFENQKGGISGTAQGKMVGGNLAVLEGLAETPYDIADENNILVIEDIAEPIYKVERILYRLKLSGVLHNLKGLVIGQFTEYKSSADYADMYSMISNQVADLNYPVSIGAPIGHVDNNLPFIEGVEISLTVTDKHTKISQIESK